MKHNPFLRSFFFLALLQIQAVSGIDREYYKTDQEIDDSWGSIENIKERGSPAQHASLNAILDSINNLDPSKKSDNIKYLGESIRKLTHTNIYQLKERFQVYDQVQQNLLVISGHAQYFGDRIHAAYEPLKGPNPGNFKSAAQSEMMYSFETLKQLPSPETVRVLGEMLSETWRLPLAGEYTPPALAYPAMTTLGDLGIRNAPWKPIIIFPDADGAIPAWQAWWEEIRSGKESFSFKGQTNEYRFKLDGTWETIQISLPASEVPAPTKDEPKKVMPHQQVANEVKQDESRHWLWITITVVTVFGMLAWLYRKKSKV